MHTHRHVMIRSTFKSFSRVSHNIPLETNIARTIEKSIQLDRILMRTFVREVMDKAPELGVYEPEETLEMRIRPEVSVA